MKLTAAGVFLLFLELCLSTPRLSDSALLRTPTGESHNIQKRVVTEDPEHHDDDHGHGDPHDNEQTASCAVDSDSLAQEFTRLAMELNFTGPDGVQCHIEAEDHHEEEGEHHEEDGHEMESSCGQTYHFMRDLLIRLNLTTPCCLGEHANGTDCHGDDEHTPGSSLQKTPIPQAYGYGFLMVVLVSLASLLGLLLLPFLNNTRFKEYYKYLYVLLIALGASALFCDAILHLIPEAFGLHDHSAATGDSHAHSMEESSEELLVVWRSCAVVLGMYIFLLVEFMLHTMNVHEHKQPTSSDHSSIGPNKDETHVRLNPVANGGEELVQEEVIEESTSDGEKCTTCQQNADQSKKLTSSILHPSSEEVCHKKECNVNTKTNHGCCSKVCNYIRAIKPLAWLIILGDGLHNFADGLALGASISQSLSLGIGTTIALIFHEIPHELGDFVILLSTGMTWYAALFFNFLSATVAIVGFFIGVSIGAVSTEANFWILAVTAGVFLYISLVDLVPQLINIKENGCKKFVLFLMMNIGFLISFAVMLLLAVYEERLNNLIQIK